jgi:outer membrane protein TolC
MKKLLFLLILLTPIGFQAQEITLNECVNAAKKNWPVFKKRSIITQQKDAIIKIAEGKKLPQLNLSAQATYRSEVTTFPTIPNPALSNIFPELPQDNYQLELGITQNIIDGQMIKAQKRTELISNDLKADQALLEEYQLIGKINQLYINYIFLKNKEDVLQLSQKEMTVNIEALKSSVENGVVLPKKLEQLQAELLKIKKELLTLKTTRQKLIESLNLLTGLNLTKNTIFQLPEISMPQKTIRPETKLLSTQINYLKAKQTVFEATKKPKLMAIGKLGYGRPGFDMFNTDLHAYYLAGLRFSWQFWDWHQLKEQKKILKNEQDILEDQKAVIEKEIILKNNQYLSDIKNYKAQIDIDKNIVILKENIYHTAKSQYDNGYITTTEYLKAFNDLKRARLQTEIDKIKLIEAQLNYMYNQGINPQ